MKEKDTVAFNPMKKLTVSNFWVNLSSNLVKWRGATKNDQTQRVLTKKPELFKSPKMKKT